MTASRRRSASPGAPATRRVARRSLARLLLVQVAVVAVALGYRFVAGQSWHPDAGRRRIDLLSLHDRLPGLAATGSPALVAVDRSGACGRAVADAVTRRARGDGVPARFGLLVLAEPGPPGGTRASVGVTRLPDPDGRLALALTLLGADGTCRPGYAVVDGSGAVRYVTRDDGWATHADEQTILLRSLR